ncbi:unnamed protein product [Cylindrotheca closterium]|uniref:UBX domain-containing protein n=1 Tax=Cylindrotheca closterium TaxID=2856 RepID=A0AAD2JPW5_9STRA|nr:unnamed protein product [Cylindrotheca closterium]
MDFESSVKRLAKDQSRMRGKLRSGAGGKGVVVSEKAKRQAEYQRKQAEKKRQERERQKKLEEYQKRYMRQCERALKTRHLSSSAAGPGTASLVLSPTSIYGDGDKIALPPSVLETLAQSAMSSSLDQSSVGSPWTFRIGILNPDYQFPSSILIKTLKPPNEDFMADSDSDDDNENDEDEVGEMQAFQDELSHKYLAYTHCTVVEFTQDEGHVGIPPMVAKALLGRNNANTEVGNNTTAHIPVKRTVDPAAAGADPDETMAPGAASSEDQTPGHLAWGAFDIPDLSLEITLLQLPKGKGCTLVPTKEAIQNNFYGLKDVKLVLEQSLIRTRATLSKGDVVCTWHRGVQFDLKVTKVIPSTYDAVTCINTDIEVEIGEAETPPVTKDNAAKASAAPKPVGGFTTGGQVLGGPSTTTPTPIETTASAAASPAPMEADLLPEPPVDVKQGVCTVHIQHSQGTGKRRFFVAEATMKDIFAFGDYLLASAGAQGRPYRLATRFPRKVWSLDNDNRDKSLTDAGIAAGQERFMVEFS